MTSGAAGYWEDPYPEYEELRLLGPMHWNDDLDTWIITGHAEARAALTNDDLSSDWLRGPLFRDVTTPATEHVRDWLMWMDPPEHGRARAAVSSIFTKGMSAARAEWIADRVAERYARFVGCGGGDAVEEFARPLSAGVIAEVAGLSAAEPTLREWSAAAAGLMAKPHHPPTVAAADHAFAVLTKEIGGDAVPAADTVVGRADPDIRGGDGLHLASLFAFAGIETTTQAVVRLLDLHISGELDLDRPSGAVVHELLRYDTPVPQVPRIAVRDTLVTGHRIGAAQTVLVLLAAANRDPGRFPDPATACPRADAAKHLAYGHGRHRCLGANLAQQVLASVADEVRRHPAPRRTALAAWYQDRGYRGIERLDLVFS